MMIDLNKDELTSIVLALTEDLTDSNKTLIKKIVSTYKDYKTPDMVIPTNTIDNVIVDTPFTRVRNNN